MTTLKHIFILLICTSQLYSFDIERRKDQYNYTPGYFAVPAPYSIPGIGEGLALVGMANNVYDSQTDFIGDIILGDVEGYGLGVMDWYVVDKHLKIDIFREGLKEASFQSHSSRGMGSDKEDYINVTVTDMLFHAFRTTASFFDKRLEFYLMYYQNEYNIDSLKDKDDKLIISTTNADTQSFDVYTTGFMIDYTDDRIDPRVGLRYDLSLDYSPNSTSTEADYFISNHNITAYIPLGNISTWAFNYFRSDAHVKSKGETDFDKLSSSLGLDCNSLSGKNKTDCQNLINNSIASNTYGNATSLGGRTRLRSYPEGRFSGAHTEFYGTELRWNLTEESTPFDVWFMKDIRTSIQTALFYERGSVADSLADLGKDEKQSYGAGVRLITGSGLVYRLDMAFGDEDYEYTVIINYPWELF